VAEIDVSEMQSKQLFVIDGELTGYEELFCFFGAGAFESEILNYLRKKTFIGWGLVRLHAAG
jgi:hypothetical protein